MLPLEEAQARIAGLQESLKRDGISGALIVQRADLYYYSGTAQNAHLLVPAEGEAVLIVKKSLPRARQESPLEKVIPFTGWENLATLVKDNLAPRSKIGLELDVLPAALYLRYQKMLAGYETVDISRRIRAARAVKSAHEINIMRRAAEIGNAVFNRAGSFIREGLREIDLAAELERHARTLGHQGAVRMRGFNQELYFGHIMSGENAAAISFFDGPTGGSGLNPSYPQGAGTSVIERNQPVIVDFVSVVEGYMVDQTRVFCLGEPAPHLFEAYRQSLFIKNELAVAGKPGTASSMLFEKAEQLAEAAGLKNHFMGYTDKANFVGHGVGLELDELPVIARGVDQALEEGMVFALEPKFIFPGEGTVGIEDTFVVGPGSLEQLTVFDERLQML